MRQPRALVLKAPGTNCDQETKYAWELAGAVAEVIHVGRVLEDPKLLSRFQILTLPGGFSYGDDLGAGLVYAKRVLTILREEMPPFLERGGLVLGICNGFQVLVRAGWLPGRVGGVAIPATLTHNTSGRYEARWVSLVLEPHIGPWFSSWTVGDRLTLPVAHGEGSFRTLTPADLHRIMESDHVPLRYADPATGEPTDHFPDNPNGSAAGVAAVTDATGQILGLMPHPERFVSHWHHPAWTRRSHHPQPDGLRLFRNAVQALKPAVV